MPAYHCSIAASAANEAVVELLNATGQAATGHIIKEGDRLLLVLSTRDIKTLRAAGLKVTQGNKLLTRAARDDVGDGLDLTTGFVSGYLDALEVDAQITSIAATYPVWCSVITLPNVTSGYDGSHAPALGPSAVRALRITANPAVRSRPGFLLICGTHAREWMNPLAGLEFAQQLLSNIDPGSTEPETIQATRIVTEGDVIIVPILNPDGLNYSIHDDAGWRKNRRINAGAPTCQGVDDNRNFGVYFGGAGSSANPCFDNYRGPDAFSETESANVRWLLEEFPNMLVGVDSHSYGNAVFRPQPGGGSFIPSLPVSAADEAIYVELETAFTNAVSDAGGPAYSTGTTSNHAGTSDEYMFFAHRVFAFDTECGNSFQPSWTNAATIIQQVVAGFRALAEATLDLTATNPVPLTAVQCIDRTGSMVSFGYDAAARNNAKRFVDLMSLGDSTGVVTFADSAADPTVTPPGDQAQVVFPLALLDDPGDVQDARIAIDGISFGGWTPIGAGLELAASMLAAAPTPRGILLLSDGYENRDPTVNSVLATWPANMPVHAIALGSAADTGLLSNIATTTGGTFQISPTALDLHLVYNQMRADMSDTDTVMNQMVDSGADDERDHDVNLEVGVARLDLSVSSDLAVPAKIMLLSPSGHLVTASDYGVSTTRRRGYVLISVDRPAPGHWRAVVGGVRANYVIAAFAKSPLTLQLKWDPERSFAPIATFDGKELASPRLAIRSHQLRMAVPPKDIVNVLRSATRAMVPGQLPAPQPANPFKGPWLRGHETQIKPPRGFSRVFVELCGTLPGGSPYKRVVMRTLKV